MVESAENIPRSNHPIFARLYPLLEEQKQVFETFEECQTYTEQLDKTLLDRAEEFEELKSIKTANYIASMCVKANKFDRAISFFEKAQALWNKFGEAEVSQPTSEIYAKLPILPYSHLSFNYANYYMHFKQALEAADHFYKGLETSPFRFCASKQPSATEEKKEDVVLKFNSVSCYAHTWSNLAVLFLLMTTVGHSSLKDIDQYDSSTVEREALLAA